MSRKLKKFASMFLAIVMTLVIGSVAMAEVTACGDHVALATKEDTYTSSQVVTLKILGATDSGTQGEDVVRLPSEYHVRVKWTYEDGEYNATQSDSDEDGGFKNFGWDCVSLDYTVNEPTIGEGGTDPREENWTSKPVVAFEVTNASTPDLKIYAQPSIAEDKWASYLNADSIADQNATIGKQTVNPVAKANLGSGVTSYEKGHTPSETNNGVYNSYFYEYEFNWNYTALNQRALELYKADTASEFLPNTFVVTITAE